MFTPGSASPAPIPVPVASPGPGFGDRLVREYERHGTRFFLVCERTNRADR
jgi:hypothetical protein